MSTNQIEISIHKLFNEGEEAKELSFLKQLNLVVNTAIKNVIVYRDDNQENCKYTISRYTVTLFL